MKKKIIANILILFIITMLICAFCITLTLCKAWWESYLEALGKIDNSSSIFMESFKETKKTAFTYLFFEIGVWIGIICGITLLCFINYADIIVFKKKLCHKIRENKSSKIQHKEERKTARKIHRIATLEKKLNELKTSEDKKNIN